MAGITSAHGIRLHPRTLPVNRAGAEYYSWLLKFQEEHQLTDAEMLLIMADAETRLLTMILRCERHPDNPDKKADEL